MKSLPAMAAKAWPFAVAALAAGLCATWMAKARSKRSRRVPPEGYTERELPPEGYSDRDRRQDQEIDRIDRASEDSFPASDPPSYTGTTA